MVALLMLAVAVMILPLPTFLIDALIAWNIGASTLILVVVVYLPQPLAFSSLPAVILTATLFRLATEIAVTRMILVQVDAGNIVRAFGDFVVSGQVVVGLVTFLIITVVQFVVITKGSERVAEVAARFTLDAMPGKQMSIDSDLRSGEINQAEARRRRQHLEQEGQLFGAMDGAMKFVKGDAIAGIIILVVNLLGGIGIGCLQLGMSWSEAIHTYSLLTVGDGLVSQIPALIISFAAGTVVTRVGSGDHRQHLGAEIAQQVAGNWKSLAIASFALTLLGTVPGFPTVIFLLLAALAGLRAFWLWRQQQRKTEAATSVGATMASNDLDHHIIGTGEGPAVIIYLSADLRAAFDPAELADKLQETQAALCRELGIDLPELWTKTDAALPDETFRLDVDAVPAASGMLKPGHLLLLDDSERLAATGIVSTSTASLPGHATPPRLAPQQGGPRQVAPHWIPADKMDLLKEHQLAFLSPIDALDATAVEVLRRLAPQFIGVQEVHHLFARVREQHRELIEAVQALLQPQIVAEVCRHLLDEGIPLRPMRLILGALVDVAAKEQNPGLLADYVRVALKRQICQLYIGVDGSLPALLIEPDMEEMLRAGQQAGEEKALARLFPTSSMEDAVADIRRRLLGVARNDVRPVVVTSFDTRRVLRQLLRHHGIDAPVLSYHELSQEFLIRPIGDAIANEGDLQEDAGMQSPGVFRRVAAGA